MKAQDLIKQIISIHNTCHLGPRFSSINANVQLHSRVDSFSLSRHFFLNPFYNSFSFLYLQHWQQLVSSPTVWAQRYIAHCYFCLWLLTLRFYLQAQRNLFGLLIFVSPFAWQLFWHLSCLGLLLLVRVIDFLLYFLCITYLSWLTSETPLLHYTSILVSECIAAVLKNVCLLA